MESCFQTRDPTILVFDGGWTARHVCLHSPKTTSLMDDGNHKCDSDFDLLVGVASYGETITHALLITITIAAKQACKHAHSGTEKSSRHDSRKLVTLLLIIIPDCERVSTAT
jgi:hypothetical protein